MAQPSTGFEITADSVTDDVADLAVLVFGESADALIGVLVEEQYRLALLAAEIAFCEEFTGKITDPDKGWGPMWAEYHGETAPLTVGA